MFLTVFQALMEVLEFAVYHFYRGILLSSPVSFCSMDKRMSLTSVQQGGLDGESELESGDGRARFFSLPAAEVEVEVGVMFGRLLSILQSL